MSHTPLDLIRIESTMTAIRKDLNVLADIVAQQALIIRNFEDERQRQLGAKGAVKFMWLVLSTGIAGVAYSLHDIVGFLWPKH